ncbi:hypothetical protein BGW41_003090 [Actinomortierella wolfii]|nr:hypothetical protein BGW41_003090 [Actinomortierella wolfii]
MHESNGSRPAEVHIHMEKDMVPEHYSYQHQTLQQPQPQPVCRACGMSRKQKTFRQRAFGLKSIIIYVLFFIIMLLTVKLLKVVKHGSGMKSGCDNVDPAAFFALSEGGGHEGEDASSPDFWIKMAMIVGLVAIGGIFAGLTLGLMGLDETNLQVLMVSGTPEEQVHAEKVYNLLSRGKHWVLVTLLVGNVIVNETLPVVLDSELGGGILAIVISTILIVIFGEIIPQAVCARYGLAIGSFCAKPMLIFMYITSPVSYPIAMLLDACLGVHHGTTYKKAELKTLVSLHQLGGIGDLTDDEVTIIASVLDLKDKPVSMVMTPLEDVFTLSEDAILDEALMEEIVNAGYSRIPIYRHDDEQNFIGMLLVKRLITYDPEDHVPVREFTINSLPQAAPNTSCLDILNFFQEGRSHMALVTSEPNGFGVPIGVITLEDVIEELLGEEIVDESDVYVDVHNKIRVVRRPTKNANMIRSLKTLLQSPALSSSTPLLGTSLERRSSGLGGPDGGYKSTGSGKTILSRRNTANTMLSKKDSRGSFPKNDVVDDHKKPEVTVETPRTPTTETATPAERQYPMSPESCNKQQNGNGVQPPHHHHETLVHFDDHVKIQPISPARSRSPQAADGAGAKFDPADAAAVEVQVDPTTNTQVSVRGLPENSSPEDISSAVVTAVIPKEDGAVEKERAVVIDVPESNGAYPITTSATTKDDSMNTVATVTTAAQDSSSPKETAEVVATTPVATDAVVATNSTAETTDSTSESTPLLQHSESAASINTNATAGSSGSGNKKKNKKKKKKSGK